MKKPRVHRVNKRGKVYKYHKFTRAALPNGVPEDHIDFVAAWEIEESKSPGARQRSSVGTVAHGVNLYLKSKQNAELSKEYRATINKNARDILQKYGNAPLSMLGPLHINSDLAKYTGTQRVARCKAWRQLGLWWKERQLTEFDPSDGIISIKAPKTDGHLPWSKDEVQAYRDRWAIGTTQRLCFELVYWTGARTVDAVVLGPRMIGGDGLLTFKQSKTQNPAHIPWTSPLPDWGETLEVDRAQMLACLPKGVFTYLETSTGKPRTKKGLSNLLSAAARKAEIQGRSAHGLRKSRLTALAEVGASVHVIMAWGGHKTLSEAQEYIKSANVKRVLIGTEQDQNTVNHIVPIGKMVKK
ncbi:MAG: tyrosine-type recombinase/integrase [Sulfitobacter sp.]